MGLESAMLKIFSHSRQRMIHFAFIVPKGIDGYSTARRAVKQANLLFAQIF
jgi:hypothetical protein